MKKRHTHCLCLRPLRSTQIVYRCMLVGIFIHTKLTPFLTKPANRPSTQASVRLPTISTKPESHDSLIQCFRDPMERCEVPSQRVVDWVSGGIPLCIYCVWQAYLLCTWLCSGTWNPYNSYSTDLAETASPFYVGYTQVHIDLRHSSGCVHVTQEGEASVLDIEGGGCSAIDNGHHGTRAWALILQVLNSWLNLLEDTETLFIELGGLWAGEEGDGSWFRGKKRGQKPAPGKMQNIESNLKPCVLRFWAPHWIDDTPFSFC